MTHNPTLKTLYLVRGWPGSGKTYYASHFLKNVEIIETNDYFMEDGEYRYNVEEVNMAHQWCLLRCRKLLEQGSVAVTNTFTRLWEMEAYIQLARELEIRLVVIRMTGNYPSPHNVPLDKIARMKARMEKYRGEVTI